MCEKCVNTLYREYIGVRGKLKVSFLPVSKQPGSYNCGLFAISLRSRNVEYGKSPVNARFDVDKMRPHLIQCLETLNLTPFPKISLKCTMDLKTFDLFLLIFVSY